MFHALIQVCHTRLHFSYLYGLLMVLKDDLAALLALIAHAFEDVSPPDAQHRTLLQAHAHDVYETAPREQDHLGPWPEIPLEHIERCRDALCHLDEQGFVYYLPALMTYGVTRKGGESLALDGMIDTLIFLLTPAPAPCTRRGQDTQVHQRRLFSLLTFVQRQAVLAFLGHLLEVAEADPAEDGEEVLEAAAAWERAVAAGESSTWMDAFFGVGWQEHDTG